MVKSENRSPKFIGLIGLILVALVAAWMIMIRMPGESFQGPLPPATDELRAFEQALQSSVHTLAGEIGERNLFHYDRLVQAAEYIRITLADAGYDVGRQIFEVEGKACENIEAELPGTDRPDEIIVIGAHYDSVKGSPGANDNGTGVAAMLSLARGFARTSFSRTLRFVAFVNEEPPFSQTEDMGSLRYAQRSKQRGESIVLMISLETIGYYSDVSGSQRYPALLKLLYPSTGNFLAFVTNTEYAGRVRNLIDLFRKQVAFPSEGAALPGWVTGVGWSDHWSFWKEGFPALMVTDTALFRYPAYHTAKDTPDKINYDRLARVVSGMQGVIASLANQPDLASP